MQPLYMVAVDPSAKKTNVSSKEHATVSPKVNKLKPDPISTRKAIVKRSNPIASKLRRPAKRKLGVQSSRPIDLNGRWREVQGDHLAHLRSRVRSAFGLGMGSAWVSFGSRGSVEGGWRHGSEIWKRLVLGGLRVGAGLSVGAWDGLRVDFWRVWTRRVGSG